MIELADNFLAGSLLTLLLPVLLLIAIAVWYTVAVRRVYEDTPTASTSLPGRDTVAAARDDSGAASAPGARPGGVGSIASGSPGSTAPTAPATDPPPGPPADQS
jgi:hypothetical protein